MKSAKEMMKDFFGSTANEVKLPADPNQTSTNFLPDELARKRGLLGPRPKGDKVRSAKFRTKWYRPVKGASFNPLQSFPRNKPCFCASGKKFKKCCSGRLAMCVSAKYADFINERWDELVDGKLTFPVKRLPIPEASK